MRRLLICLFCAPIPVSFAVADSAQRKMPEAETSAYDSVRTAVREALPKPPEGFSFLFTSEAGSVESAVPAEAPSNGMLPMVFRAAYKANAAPALDAPAAVFMARAEGTTAQKERAYALSVRERELRTARDRAASYSEKNKIRAELKQVREEMSRLNDAIAAGSKWAGSGEEAAEAAEAPPKEYTIRIDVNEAVTAGAQAAPCSLAGAPSAFALTEGCEDSAAYCVTALLGGFERIEQEGGAVLYRPLDVPLEVATEVRTIAITVGGAKDDAPGVREFAEKIDFAKLEALLP